MNYEVYCDESRQDLIAKQQPEKYFMIGGLWLLSDFRKNVKNKITELRQKYRTWGEIKWSKISPSRKDFYLALIDLFVQLQGKLKFKCIIVESSQVDMSWHNHDKELGFYKFYYELLHKGILNSNSYSIYCDTKTSRDPLRLRVLADCLRASNPQSKINSIQALPSHEVVLIQFADFLLGAVSAKINNSIKSKTKLEVIQYLEESLGCGLESSSLSEEKFNVFKIMLEGKK